ncbi:peptidylprolyl isomerase [Halomonas sp. HP20-15]|uniref:peptidylprolyl isomerase n=1 Tax=Halomonas sp. HP20-15 TaxID=3085901 RepID=UPI0029810DA8|nr:peptidylprolyl isomerase [Halomonas sp. HP20-15]MDW5375640.1 peptidylprolyl isomerase [Halomonas sp. HP20-15]
MQLIPLETLPANAQTMAIPPVWVGVVNIPAEDIAREMQYHQADSVEEAQLEAARALVVRELLRQRCSELGWDIEDGEEAALAALLDAELEVPEPDEDHCRRYFEANAERFSEPLHLSVRHILLAAAPDDAVARDSQYRLGQALVAELQTQPERFVEFAQRHSACPSKDDGGELGWLAPGQTVAELDRALQRLPEGLHDRPLASRYGWHVVSLDHREGGRILSYAEAAERVRHTLREQATRRALRHYLLALEARLAVSGVSLDDENAGALMQ